jgi:hypothetical protein
LEGASGWRLDARRWRARERARRFFTDIYVDRVERLIMRR